jgi:16S rRNA (adenine1518-N6/adenine1519-N6)-dimethyltransferase
VENGLQDLIEIGAGTGVLTEALLGTGARVTALEIDPDMTQILAGRSGLAGARIVGTDALAFDYDEGTAERWCACGNLPYNIATPLVLRLVALARPPERIVVMVQRDVADRFTARPSTPAYGSLTVTLALHVRVRRAFVLGPSAFYPRPRVDSAVVVMERLDEPPVPVRDRAFLLQVVRAAFAYRRKTLANSLALALGIARPRTQRTLAALGFDTEIRAEQLDLGAFAALAGDLAA